MTRSEVKKARQELTGGMPTGEYRMQGLEAFTVWRKLPVSETGNVYITSLDEALAWCEEQERLKAEA